MIVTPHSPTRSPPIHSSPHPSHSMQIGVRALILSPTRELATQTFKFSKELSKFTDLRAALVLGGDSIEEQFSAVHQNPDM